MTEPEVWVPSASGTIPAPTAAAEPEEEPPGVRAASCGLVVGPGRRLANSAVTTLPKTTPAAARVSATTEASRFGLCPAWISEP